MSAPVTVYKAVCRAGGCRGIESGPYTMPSHARSDKHAHDVWHERRGESPTVEVVAHTED